MSTSSSDSIFCLGTTRMVAGPGATQAVLVNASAVPGCNSIIFKYFSGGTAEIVGVTTGQTLTAAQMVTLANTGYVMGTSEVLSLDGPARFYFFASGSSTACHVIFGKSQGS